MAQVAYILLCHRNPAAIAAQARQLAAAGDRVAIHFDARAPQADFDRLRSDLRDTPGIAFARRVTCGWGEWSLVAATLEGMKTALSAFPDATHLYLLSGDCMAIKTAEWTHAFLDARNADHIECVDFHAGGWIKTGLREERLIYRHWFNERSRKRLFYASLDLQKRLGLSRRTPAGLRIMIGSQWWCLRRGTAEAVLAFLRRRADVTRFFRTTWIPDETFFQTLVAHLVPEDEIVARTPTFLMFTDYGVPVTFYNDHYDLLLAQEAPFARKISPEARELRARLGALYATKGVDFRISDEGRRLHAFLTAQGRTGQRFAPRFWEEGATVGRDRELMIVTCKKWHVARRLVDALSFQSNLPAVEYIFDEEASPLPDLGGIETTLAKRTRHRRALMRLVFEHMGSDRLVMCLDPANFDLLSDFTADRCTTRILEIDCTMTDAWLEGHARRVGLAGPQTSPEAVTALIPAVRNDLHREVDRIRAARFPGYHRIAETAGDADNAAALASFFSIPEDKARALARTPHLFAD
ncbi:MAG: beta-1,6-N-acetylglucosaminyltransferase [Rhodobacteraceae bacterium]|nr:beta-1,6-N-acetylglucosaminyltransferase [Paracoccaceae bacterium]